MNTKRILSMVLAIILTVSLFAGITGTAYADDSQVITHTVSSGQYLQKICKSYGLTYDSCKKAIMLLNGFTSNTQLNRIYPGQVIKLPASDAIASTVRSEVVIGNSSSSSGSSTTPTTSNGDSVAYYLVQHTVKSGETLAGICNSLGSSYSQYANTILTINGISSVTHVYAGKTIYIPVTSKPTTGTYYSVVAHKVVSGETTTAICNTYGMNYSNNRTLVNGLNDGYNLNSIKVGQTIYVPTTKTISSSGGSGSSSSTTTGYAITIASSGTGTAYATVNGATVTTAAKDAKVVINATTATSSVLKIEKVQRADTKALISFDEANDSFTMPNCAVIVTVSFTQGKAINKQVSGEGSFETYVNDTVASFTAPGKTVTVKTSPDSGYVTESVTVSGAVVKKVANNTYTFTMPNSAANVVVKFKAATYYEVTVNYDSVGKTTTTLGSAIAQVDGVKVTKVAESAVVVVKGSPITGYIIDKVQYVYGSTTKNATKISDNEWSFEMPASKTDIVVVFGRNDRYNINTVLVDTYGYASYKVKDDNGNLVDTNSAKAGESVYATVSSQEWWNVTLDSISYANGTATVPFEKPSATCPYYKFTMPAASVTVYTKAVEDDVNRFYVCHDPGAAFETFKVSGGVDYACLRFAQGETVKLVATVPTGKTVQFYMSDGTKYNAMAAGNSITFTMPGYNVGIKAEVVSATAATISAVAPSDKGALKVYSSGTEVANSVSGSTGKVYSGNTVTFAITCASDDYQLSAVTVSKNGGTPEDITDTYNKGFVIDAVSTYEFAAVFKAADEYDITKSITGLKNESTATVSITENGNNVTSAKAGKTITVSASTTESGKRLGSITVNGVDKKISSGSCTFEMPGEKANVVVTFIADTYTVHTPNETTGIVRTLITKDVNYSDLSSSQKNATNQPLQNVENGSTVRMYIQVVQAATFTHVYVDGTEAFAITAADGAQYYDGYGYWIYFTVTGDTTPQITVS